MNTLILDRFCNAEFGTYGRLRVPSGFECYTVERPWRYNKPFVSCVPTGRYGLAMQRYRRGEYDTVGLVGVEARSHILVHKGNKPEQVQGCIAIGTGLGTVDGVWAVTHSADAFAVFWPAIQALADGDSEMELLIRCSRWQGGDYMGVE